MGYPSPPPLSLLTKAVTIRVGPRGGAWVNSLTLPANPDEELDYDARVTLIQTITGAYFDDYGLGVTRLTLTGTTAWMSPKGRFNRVQVNGTQAARHLYRDILLYYFAHERSHTSPSSMEMVVFDEAAQRGWRVKPIPPPLTTTRSKADPMVVHYVATFAVEADLLSDPQSPDQVAADPVRDALTKAVSSPAAAKKHLTQTTARTTSASQATPRKYTVASGDTLWSVAQSFYGQGSLWTRIWDANKSVVANPNLIVPGEVLIIPPGPGANNSKASASAIGGK